MEGFYVDNSKELTHVGLCAGYGGIELGLKRVIPALRTVALCEIEAFACANLVAKMEAGLMDPAPIWTNLKTFPWEGFRDRMDILTGGYPCQPFSAAGQRKGADDPRHLWPFISAGIAAMRPRLCFFENVEGHISLGLPDVIEDLGRLGYRATWGLFSASEVGAPHQRKRVFIMAHRSGAGLEGLAWHGAEGNQQGRIIQKQDGPACQSGLCAWPSRPGEPQHAWEPPRVVGYAECLRWSAASGNDGAVANQERKQKSSESKSEDIAQTIDCASVRQTQPALGRDTDGAAGGLDDAELCESCDNRTDELRLLGNGVVPATAALAFETLARELFL